LPRSAIAVLDIAVLDIVVLDTFMSSSACRARTQISDSNLLHQRQTQTQNHHATTNKKPDDDLMPPMGQSLHRRWGNHSAKKAMHIVQITAICYRLFDQKVLGH